MLQLGAQLKAIWTQLGIRERVTLAVAAVAVFAGLLTLVVWSNRPDYSLLYGRLSDSEAAKVVAALEEANVPYRMSATGGSIHIPTDKVHKMRMQLASKGIPQAGDGVGFEIFDKPNFGISDFVQRANYLRAVQGELARTISNVDSIESARVMIVMPENRLMNDETRRPTASVFVRVRGGQLPPQTVNAIRFMVANAVEGLQANYVSVVDNLGNVLSENQEDNSVLGLTTTQLAARKELESYLTKKAEGMLEAVLGPGQSVVRVSAEINFDTLQTTEEKFDPEGQVARTETVNDENSQTTNLSVTSAGGAPGVQANSTTETNTVASTPSNATVTKKKVTNTDYEINKTTSTMMQGAGGLKRISAAVFVNARMTGTGTNRVQQPRTPEEMQKLRRIVQSALGIVENPQSPQDQITLEEMPFNDQPQLEMVTRMEREERRNFWIETGRNAIYPILGLALLAVFWRAFQRTPVETIPIGIPLHQFENGNGYTNGNGNGYRNGNGSVITAEALNQLIRENPENMTEAIRGWMTKDKRK